MEFASTYPTRFLRTYVRMKVAGDPAYDAVFETLRGSTDGLLDLGCGVGALAFYLRERGYAAPIAGVDHDRRKVEIARGIASGDRSLTFRTADVRTIGDIPPTVVLLDILHYLTDGEQAALLGNLAAAANTVVIRDAIRDRSWRYWITVGQETLSRAGGWLKAERLNFPTRESIEGPFREAFRGEVRTMFGRMPFNNYLFVFRRSSPGMTNV